MIHLLYIYKSNVTLLHKLTVECIKIASNTTVKTIDIIEHLPQRLVDF